MIKFELLFIEVLLLLNDESFIRMYVCSICLLLLYFSGCLFVIYIMVLFFNKLYIDG